MSGDTDASKKGTAHPEAIQNQGDASTQNHAITPLLSHEELITELYRDFGRIASDKKSGSITAKDVDTFLGRPHLSEDQLEVGHFLKENFTKLAKENGTPGQIRQSDLEHMKDAFAPGSDARPDPSIVGRSAAGGAIAGGVTSRMQGDSFGSGAGKGAAVGATIGLLAYGAEEAHFNTMQNYRDAAAGLHYSQTRYTDAAPMTDEEIYKLADKPIAFDQASAMVEKFRKNFSKIDFDNTGSLTSDELKEAIRSNYIPDDQKPLAAALAKHIDEIEKLNEYPDQQYNITDYGLHQLAMALQLDNHDALAEVRDNRNTMTGVTSTIGAFWGGVIGAAIGNVPGAFIGAGIGGSITGGGTFYITNKHVKQTAAYEDHLRKDVLKQTMHDLNLPKQND